MALFNRFQDYFLNRIALSTKKEHPIYILPTLNGLKVLSLNFLLLVIGLIYANNYVLLFNFLLFCLVLSSMFYTHHNLKNVSLKSMIGISGHNKEIAFLNITLNSNNKQNNYELKIKIPSGEFFEHVTFSVDQIVFQKDSSWQIPLRVKKRGRAHIVGLFLETDFPLGFFRCFTFYPMPIDMILYPARASHHPQQSLSRDSMVQSNHQDDDQMYFRQYQAGDSFNRLDWKRYAKDRQMNVKFHSAQEQKVDFISIHTTLKDSPDVVEAILEQACYELHLSFQSEREFGLLVNDVLVFEANSGPDHLEQCLKYIGLYEH